MWRSAVRIGVLGGVLVVSVVVISSSAPGAASRAPVKLHGVMHVGSYTFKRGTTYVVTKSLTIVASGKVVIDGPIQLAPGAGLRIQAKGAIVNAAPISPLPRAKTGGRMLQATAGDLYCAEPGEIKEFAISITIETCRLIS